MSGDPSFLERLAPEGRRAVDHAGTERRHRRDTTVFREGDVSREVVIILEGRVKLTKLSPDGREIILDLRGPGDIIGEMAAVDGAARSASAVFLTEGRALHLPGEEFNALIDNEPSVAAATLRTVVHRLRVTSERQLEFGTETAVHRVCGRLVELMDDLSPDASGTIHLRSPISQQELAEWSGVSRDAVVRVLKMARDLGWLETGRQSFIIHRPDELRAHAL